MSDSEEELSFASVDADEETISGRPTVVSYLTWCYWYRLMQFG